MSTIGDGRKPTVEMGQAGAPGGGQPAAGPEWVRRRLLFDRFSSAGPGGVVLVCAPAGSGKTVLVRSWVQTKGLAHRTGWVTVERGERDPQRFWLSVIDALAGAVGVVQRVDPSPAFGGEAVVDRLLGDLGSLDRPAVLVIDDLHELGSVDALRWLEGFLARVPAELRVVLATREDPRLGLHRLRLSGQLTELRAADLRFSLEETEDLLRRAGITLSDGGLALLYERTEGWAAGLRLAAISLAHHPDPERFVTEFSGSERTVAGYLLAEVLERQPPDVRDMLLRTSVLDRVSGALADHLTGATGSERKLQELEDEGAFVTSLDAGRSWFRYHHLFADLLQLELRRLAPDSVVVLHREAARWYEREGYTVEAIRHAQRARDWPLASRQLADHHIDLTLSGHTGTVRELLRAFGQQRPAQDAELSLAFATADLLDGALDTSAAYIDLAQRLADTVPAERRASFDLLLAALRLTLARWRGDHDTALEAMRSVDGALAAQPATERAKGDELKAVALQNLGVAELWASRLDDARRDLDEALVLTRRAGRAWLEVSCLGHLAIAGVWTGLSFAAGLELSEEAVQIAETHGWGEDPIIVTALATGAMGLLWLGRLDEAEQWLGRAQRTLLPEGEPGTELIVHHARGLLHLGQSRLEDALAAFRAAEHMQALLVSRHAFALSVQARLLQTRARLGELPAARAALADIGPEERDTADMRTTAAVIEIAGGEPQRALDELAPVLERPAQTLHRPPCGTIEAQLLDAVAREQDRDHRGAQASLEQALELAEPEWIILPFLVVPVSDLLEGVPHHRTAHATLRRTILDVLSGSASEPAAAPARLLDELSEAELRVVRYLPSNLRAPEIAAELLVSTNTVRTHLRHIYAKLDAHERAEAVARARQLGLLAPSYRR